MKTKGFTLVEIMIASSIFMILLASVFAVMNAGKSSWFTGGTVVELRQEIAKAFMVMEKELRETCPNSNCTNFEEGDSGSSIGFKLPQDKDHDGTILDSLGDVEYSNNMTTYALNGANQITKTISGKTTVLANNITSLQFNRPEGSVNLLYVTITAQKKSPTGRTMQDSGEIVIKMRNK